MGETLRDVLQGLRPALLDRFGLEAALREGPLQHLLADAGIDYVIEFSGPVTRLGVDAASAIYRIAQEAATNCVRHARATRFRIAVDIDPTFDGSLEVHLRIEDDGCGFDPARNEREGRGSGLRGIRDRVLALGGESGCETGPQGTRHTVWFVDRASDGARVPRVS
jgi:two-component system sensor histidine kinase UhpB